MKTTELNKINQTQTNEVKALAAAALAQDEATVLAAVKPESFLDLLDRVYNDEVKMITDEHDNIVGMNISKSTGVNVVKYVNGTVIIGATEAEAKEDALNQKKFAKAYEGKPVQRWYELCLQLKAANYHPDEVVDTREGLIFILASAYKAINENGSTVVTVDVPKGTAKTVVIELIKAKLIAKEVEALRINNKVLQNTVQQSFNKIDKLADDVAEKDAKISKLMVENQSLRNTARTTVNSRKNVQAGTVGSVSVEVGDGYCTITLCEQLPTMTLSEAILGAINRNRNLISMTRGDNPYEAGARFIGNRIQSNIPIEANSKAELKSKVSKIVYGALKDSETLGFSSGNGGNDSNTAMQLSDKIAENIIANAILG